MNKQHWVYIDDRSDGYNRNLSYIGSWGEWTVRQLVPVPAGNDDVKTVHATSGQKDSYVTFDYEGSDVVVWGSACNATSAKVSCVMDGRAVQTDPIPTSELSRWRLCYTTPGQTLLGTHRLTLSISSNDTKSQVGVHSIQYLSKPDIDMSSQVGVVFPNSSGVILVGDGWSSFQDDNGVSRWMGRNNDITTSLQLSFNGVVAELYGFFWAGAANLSSNTGYYSIDNGPRIPFELPSSNGIFNQTSGTNQVFPQIPMLRTVPVDAGDHTLVINWSNLGSSVPLTFDYFLVYPGRARADGTGSKGKAGQIVGMVLGGLLVIALAGYFLYRRFLKERKKGQEGLGHYQCLSPHPYIEFDDRSNPSAKPIVVEISQTQIVDFGHRNAPFFEVPPTPRASTEQRKASPKRPALVEAPEPRPMVQEDQPPGYSA